MTEREIYLIRHGATALNGESGGTDRIRGWKNVPLSAKGREEVKELAGKLKNSGLEVLVSSPLERAHDTANAIAKTTGAHVLLSAKLKPWDVGEFTGHESSVIHPKLVEFAVKKPEKKIPGGESFDEFKDRIFSGLREHLHKHDGAELGLVTHHRVERLINAWIKEGQKPDGLVDLDVMFKKGEKPAHAIKLKIDTKALKEMRL